jgi:hypothetical protein
MGPGGRPVAGEPGPYGRGQPTSQRVAEAEGGLTLRTVG